MGAFLANIALTEVFYDPLDFKYRIIGEELISRLGNLTGKRVREMATAVGDPGITEDQAYIEVELASRTPHNGPIPRFI